MTEAARDAVGDIALVVFPSTCRACGEIVASAEWAPLLCAACATEIPYHDESLGVPPPLSRGHALTRFEGPARRLLIDLKYQGVVRAGRALGRAMAAAPGAGRVLWNADIVVPLHWRRRWYRGSNQAAVLAFALCRHACPRVGVHAVLRRHRATRRQVGLHRAERAANVHDAFGVRRRYLRHVRGKVVLLVDDVVTTGSTAAAAAAPMLRAGAREVRLYAAAWAPNPRRPVAGRTE